MADILILISVLIIFIAGFFVMNKIDIFFSESYQNPKNESNKPSVVFLTDHLTDEEILKEIHDFKEKYSNPEIILYDNSDIE